MFDQMFSLFFGLSCETMILEACEWDEERAKVITETFSNFINDCAEEGIVDKNDVIEKIKLDLGDELNKQEECALIEIFDSSIENMPFLLNSGDGYEN
jgi:hypothetical protein